ncbi:MAG TPA: helix-turn-helix domain-containing protein [Thermoleophilaceae bacterium]|nr:helix-turn-helix domain-containing protein [Thermoleophilaceae bacterium]
MPGIGDTLREARMRQQLDIADVEARTKIRAKYLRALENEEFGLLPGSTFVKTFLRTYAEVLGLDSHRLVDEYRLHHEPEDELDAQHLAPSAGTARDREPRGLGVGPPGPGTVVLGVVIAVIALLLVLGLTGGDDDGEQASRTDTERTRPEPQRTERRPASPRAVTLRVTPSVETYVCVDTGAGTDVAYEGILAEPRTFRGRRLRVNLGKTSVEMRANGDPVEIEQGPNPAGFEFTPRGMRSLPLGERPCA